MVHIVALRFRGLRMLELEVNCVVQGAVSILFAIRITSNLSLFSDVFSAGVNVN